MGENEKRVNAEKFDKIDFADDNFDDSEPEFNPDDKFTWYTDEELKKIQQEEFEDQLKESEDAQRDHEFREEYNGLSEEEYNQYLDEEHQKMHEDYYQDMLRTYDADAFNSGQMLKISRQAKSDIKEGIKFQLIRHCTNFSYYNETALEIMFHSLISAITKDINIKVCGGKFPFEKILHLFWCQASGSGKGKAFKEVCKIIDKYNKVSEKPLVYEMLDGSESSESYLNTFNYTKGNRPDFESLRKGILEKNDIIFVEECSYILLERRGIRQTRAEYLLHALEGKTLTKELLSWNGHVAKTNSNFVWFASSRNIPEITTIIGESGLLARPISYFRELSGETRQKMTEMLVADKSKTPEQFEDDRENIAARLNSMRSWLKKNNDFSFGSSSDRVECLNLVTKYIKEMNDYVKNKITNSLHREMIESFIGRYTDKLFTLAVHGAILRKSTEITLADINTAGILVLKVFDGICLYVEDKINDSTNVFWRKRSFEEDTKKLFMLKQEYEHGEFVEVLSRFSKYSQSYCYRLLQKNSESENSLLKIEDGKVMLRKR